MKEKDKKTRNIERAMRECFEEIGIPKLTKDENSKLSKTVMDGADDIWGFGISLFYDDYYYNRATIRIVTDKRIPAEKEAPVRELLNIINSDLAFDHFCLEPGNHTWPPFAVNPIGYSPLFLAFYVYYFPMWPR